MGVALRHDRLLMLQEPLNHKQVNPGLYDPARERSVPHERQPLDDEP